MKTKLDRMGLFTTAFAFAFVSIAGVAAAEPARGEPNPQAERGEHARGLHGGGKDKAERFRKADKNGDGFLTEDEVSAKKWARIKVADANGDGKISEAELRQAYKEGKIQHKKKDKSRKDKTS